MSTTRKPTTSAALSRRAMIAGIGVAAAAPAALAAPAAKPLTPIARLWRDAENLRAEISAYRSEIELASVNGVPGWMRLGGDANRLAEKRYGKLVEILNAPAKNVEDLKIIGQVSMDSDILNGARSWAAERLASAAQTLAA